MKLGEAITTFCAGTSEGAEKGWDTRGRGKAQDKKIGFPSKGHNFVLIRDNRYSDYTRATNAQKGWKVLAEYNIHEMSPETEVPDSVKNHYSAHKEFLGYAPFHGLSKEDALHIIGLSKTGKAGLGIDRWGRIASYKLK